MKQLSSNSLLKMIAIITLILILSITVNIYSIVRLNKLETNYDELKVSIEQSNEANQKVLEMLKEVRDAQKKQNEMMQLAETKRKESISLMKSNGFNEYSDLAEYKDMSVEDMDKIIDYYDSHINGGTPFKGKGYVFVQASKETGLNPIYIFSHAVVESGFGKSYLAQTRHNYFGINAVDSNPENAYSMGDSIDSGIINGAHWIKETYYENGYTNLYSMKKAGYASDSEWYEKISEVANDSIELL